MQTLILAITAVMLTLLGGGAALAVPGPSVRAEATPIEGRLVFEWDAPTAVQTLRAGQRLTLRFTRLPPADDLFVAMARLAPWLSNLTPAARPGEVGLELRDGVSADVRQGAAAERTVVVLRHRSATSRMPTGAAVPIHGPEMDVRSGTHPGFGRLVLDGGAPLGSEVHREGDELVVATRVALPERARTQALTLPRWISGATLEGRTLRLRLGPGVVVREERPNAAKLVLDFSVPAPRSAVPTVAPTLSAAPVGTTAGTPGTTGAAEMERGTAVPPVTVVTTSLTPASDPADARVPEVAPHAGPKALLRASGPSGETGVATFRWRKPVRAAAFERADILWVVFGAALGELAGTDESDLNLAGLRELERVERQGLTVFRYFRSKREPLRVEGGGAAWHLQRGEPPSDPGKNQEARVSRDEGGRLVLATAGTLAQLEDPEAGDLLSLLLVPEAQPWLGAPLAFVDLEFLPSLAGMVWRPLADGLSAVPGPDRVELHRPGGLRSASGPLRPGPGMVAPPEVATRVAGQPAESRSVSADVAATPAATPDRERDLQPSTPDSVVEPLALAGSAGPSRPPFAIQRQELLRELASLEGAEAGSARLRLARLFLADALGAEALAVLDAATPDWPGKEGETPRREVALRAAAEFLLGRERRASELLATIPGSGDAELALWRAAAAAALEKWDEAARELTSAGNVWAEYPPRLRFVLGLAIADALGQAGRVDPALAAADKLAQYPASRVERSRLSLLKASLLARDGRGPAASAAFAEAAGRGDLAIKVLARFLDTVSGLERGQLSADEARQRLGRERLLWRGHAWEARMLDALAGLQADGDDPVAALATWQTVLSREPDETTAAGIVGRMRKALARSLAPDNADAVDPVTALALLKTFPLLLPDAEPGCRLVYGVAARLAEAGLPAQAAGLLDEHHARAGPPAASGLLELARYQLAADEADAARATVSRVDVKGDALAADRRVTEAEALLALGRAGDALRLLEGHSGANVLRLRALAMWRLGAWSRLREELSSDGSDAGTASEGEHRTRLAVADAHAGDVPALTEQVGPVADRGSQAVLNMILASSPAAGSAQSVIDQITSNIKALRLDLDILWSKR